LSESGRPVGSFVHHTPKLGILLSWENGTISFENFVATEISCCAPRFPLILTSKFHSLYVEESESEISERSELESNILPPTPQPWFERSNLCSDATIKPNKARIPAFSCTALTHLRRVLARQRTYLGFFRLCCFSGLGQGIVCDDSFSRCNLH